jgi:hypothetical protein
MPDNDLQKLSPAYRLPASDPDFILSDSMQGVRFLLEFAKADERLRSWGVRTTIVVLGSARLREANGDGRGVPAAASMARWYDEARRFGRIVSERGGALAPIDGQRDNVIATGGGPGIMEAANRGACDVGAPSIGFNIQWIRFKSRSDVPSTNRIKWAYLRCLRVAKWRFPCRIFPNFVALFCKYFQQVEIRENVWTRQRCDKGRRPWTR